MLPNRFQIWIRDPEGWDKLGAPLGRVMADEEAEEWRSHGYTIRVLPHGIHPESQRYELRRIYDGELDQGFTRSFRDVDRAISASLDHAGPEFVLELWDTEEGVCLSVLGCSGVGVRGGDADEMPGLCG